MKIEAKKNKPRDADETRTFTDKLDNAVLDYVSSAGEVSVRRIATEIERPYSTVMVRCLKLEASGLLRSTWYNNVRQFRVVNQHQEKCLTKIVKSGPES